jgi:hypothetical protein
MNYRPLFGYTQSLGNLDAGPSDLVGPAPFDFLQYENIWTSIAQDFYSEFSTMLSAVWIDIDSGTKERINAVLNQMVFTEGAKVEEINGILSSWGATNITQGVSQDGGGDPVVLDNTIPDDFQNNALSTVWIELGTPSYGITALTYDILPEEVKSTVLGYAQEYLNTSDKTYLANIVSLLLGEWNEFNPDSLIVDEDDFADVDGSWGNLFGDIGEGIDEFTDWVGDLASGETTLSDIFTNVNAALSATIGADFANSDFANIVLGTVTELAKDFPMLTAEQIAQAINFFKVADFPKFDPNELVAALYTAAAPTIDEAKVFGNELVSTLTDSEGLCSARSREFVRNTFGTAAGDAWDRFCGLPLDAKQDVLAINQWNVAGIIGVAQDRFNQAVTAIVAFGDGWTDDAQGSTPAQTQQSIQGDIAASIARAGEAHQTSNLTNNIIGGVAIAGTAILLMQLVKKVRGG